jgi:hypothetical protein
VNRGLLSAKTRHCRAGSCSYYSGSPAAPSISPSAAESAGAQSTPENCRLYAHDWQNAPQASATFLGLAPIASFITSGAKPASDLAVVTARAEIRLAAGVSLMGKFDGEFGQGTQSYVGTGAGALRLVISAMSVVGRCC